MFRAMGNFHRSVEIAIFTDEIPPQIARPFPIPETVTDFLKCSEQWAIFTDRRKSRDVYR